MMSEVNANSIETTADLGKTSDAVARRWKLELKLADKREGEWRKKATAIYKLYTPESPSMNSFNVLWPNTETLRQSVYNSLPQPDVRRRYQDDDPLGKSVSEVMTRALEFAQDSYDFDAVLKADVLTMLLPGRAVSRVRYVPSISEVDAPAKTDEASDSQDQDTQEDEPYEKIDWEQVICERVQWDDFRILCAAKTWEEVTAIGFRHRFSREDCIEKFGEEIGKSITLDMADDEDIKKSSEKDLFKTAEIWEIWDKEQKEVVFICKSYHDVCKTQPDPMKLSGFFPIPRPLYAIESDSTLVPNALYTQYEQQAKELNKISQRINKLIDALKVRGIYDATLSELSRLMQAGDNELIPSQNATALMERGGLEKAIWMLPMEMAAAVIKELYVQRDATKQVIYEITGISDIMRSASDPNETFGAQKIKTQWGTQRLQRMQKEVQRYIRDLIRLKAEVIAEKFQMETLKAMTLVDLPHQAQVDQQNQQAMMQYQQAMQQFHMQAMQQGQPPAQPPQPPQPQSPITWEAVCEAMKNDATRTYRIDIETDSTLSATQDSDMQGLEQVLTAVVKVGEGFAPAVQAGAMPIEAVKEIMLAVVRRAKLGSAVEDALEKMQQPAPQPQPPDPNAGKLEIEQQKMQGQMQLEQQKMQQEIQLRQMEIQGEIQRHAAELEQTSRAAEAEAQREMQMEHFKQSQQAEQTRQQNEIEAARDVQNAQLDAHLQEQQRQHDFAIEQMRIEFDREKAQLDYRKAIEVAEIAAAATLQTAQATAANNASKSSE